MKPRLSIGGFSILFVYMAIFLNAFRGSSYFYLNGHNLVERQSQDAQVSLLSTHLTSFVFACSALNVASHSAVVLGALDDTFVASILVGVGFDVFSSFLILAFWVSLSQSLEEVDGEMKLGNFTFLFLLGASFRYQIVIHVKALLMSHSFERTASVVRSAVNNIKGEAGPAYADHLFAYTDLGYHLFHLIVSFLFLWSWGILKIGVVVVSASVLLAFTFLFFQRRAADRLGNVNFTQPKAESSGEIVMVSVNRQGKLECSCKVCKESNWGTSFCINLKRTALCQLWFLTFGQLLDKLDEAGRLRSKQLQ